jgi:hypothetical protein
MCDRVTANAQACGRRSWGGLAAWAAWAACPVAACRPGRWGTRGGTQDSSRRRSSTCSSNSSRRWVSPAADGTRGAASRIGARRRAPPASPAACRSAACVKTLFALWRLRFQGWPGLQTTWGSSCSALKACPALRALRLFIPPQSSFMFHTKSCERRWWCTTCRGRAAGSS